MSATQALAQALSTPSSVVRSKEPMIQLKRTYFDMTALEEVSQQVEDSIAFPTIEWAFSDDDEEDVVEERPAKRSCNELSRKNASCDLASLSVRCGSNGSMC